MNPDFKKIACITLVSLTGGVLSCLSEKKLNDCANFFMNFLHWPGLRIPSGIPQEIPWKVYALACI